MNPTYPCTLVNESDNTNCKGTIKCGFILIFSTRSRLKKLQKSQIRKHLILSYEGIQDSFQAVLQSFPCAFHPPLSTLVVYLYTINTQSPSKSPFYSRLSLVADFYQDMFIIMVNGTSPIGLFTFDGECTRKVIGRLSKCRYWAQINCCLSGTHRVNRAPYP